MRKVTALVLCGVVLAGHARADAMADIQAATDAFRQGDLTTAEVLLSEVIDSGQLDDDKGLLAKALAWRCAIRVAAGQHDAAAGDCERTIEIDPTFSSAHLNLGIVHVSKLQPEVAIAEFSLALQHGRLPQNEIVMAHTNRGLAYLLRRDNHSALNDFDSALAIDPTYVPALNGRATSYAQIGEFDKAMADVEAALSADPASPKSINTRGLVRLYKRQFDEAIADFTSFVESTPDNPTGYFNRALALFLKSDWNAAVTDLDRSLEISPDLPSPLYLRGLARRKLGQDDLAQQDIDDAIAIYPAVETDTQGLLSKLQPP